MQVRCPHCAHVFTASASGIQSCPACSTPIDVPAFEGQSTAGGFSQNSSADVRAPTPWEDRERIGFVQGFFRTWQQSVLKPQEFWPTVRPDGSLGSALAWGWLMNIWAMLLSLPVLMLQFPAISAQFEEMQSQMGGNAEAMAFLHSVGVGTIAGGLFLASLILWPVTALIAVSLVHVSAVLLGAGKGGFTASARAFFYAQGPNVLNAIPLVGALVSLYSVVLFGWGLKEVHGTTPAKATLALLIPMFIGFCCFCSVLMAGAVAMGAAMGAAGQ